MTTQPVKALDALLDELTRRGSPLATYLRPGLPRDEIAARMSAVGAVPHPDVISLFAWHDGFDRFQVPVSSEGLVSLVPSHMEFNPLNELLDTFSSWRKFALSEGQVKYRGPLGSWIYLDPDELWPPTWFPIFEGGGSEVIFISNEAGDPGSVWRHPVQDQPLRLYDSLATAADDVRGALVEGRLLLDSLGVFTLESRTRSGFEL
jgi:hypothetical protein